MTCTNLLLCEQPAFRWTFFCARALNFPFIIAFTRKRSAAWFAVHRHLHFPACFWTMDPKLWGIQYSYLYLRKDSEKECFYQILLSISQPQIFEQQDGLQPESSASNGQAKMGLVSPDQRTFTKEQYMGRLSAGGSQIHVGQGFRPLGPFVSKNIMG